MFNNVRYKIDEEVHEPIIIKSSVLQQSCNPSSKECVDGVCLNPLPTPNVHTQAFIDHVILYKSKSLFKRILGIPSLIIKVIKFINNI